MHGESDRECNLFKSVYVERYLKKKKKQNKMRKEGGKIKQKTNLLTVKPCQNIRYQIKEIPAKIVYDEHS